MDTKQPTFKEPTSQRKNQNGNKNYLETNENETNEIMWDVAKVFLEESL